MQDLMIAVGFRPPVTSVSAFHDLVYMRRFVNRILLAVGVYITANHGTEGANHCEKRMHSI
jgi:hypothetical protein